MPAKCRISRISPRRRRNSALLRWRGRVEVDVDDAFDAAGARGHDDDAVAHVDRLVDVVGDEQHRRAARFPEAQHLVLHAHAREGVERAERLVEQQHLRVIDQRAGERDALGHAAGEMVRVGVGEGFQADEAHELVDLVALLAQHAARDQARLDVAADGEPGEQVGVLEDQAALGARAGDRLGRRPRARRQSGASSPAIRRSSVDLPQPLGPTSDTSSPGRDRERHAVERVRASLPGRPASGNVC